ncbi:MAG TPA: glycosyltransferase [Solirubrobacterales bacterium]|nr:glycosyltransferase [Solirubrobacterales bacterium]
MSSAPEVSVYVQTYRHRDYISDALDGVLAQRTPFEVEIVVADDCSTDGTRELLLAYRERHPDRIRLLLPERNLGPSEIFRRSVGELRGEYVAWLDGDDYWSDPDKLLLQVEAMRAHPEWSACFHDAVVRHGGGSAQDRPYVPADLAGPLRFEDLLRVNNIPSLSVMALGDHVRDLPEWVWEGLWADWLAMLAIASHGPIGYLPRPMGVYRVHDRGISAGRSREEQLEEDLRTFSLLDRALPPEHRPALERSVRDRRCQLAVERCSLPFSGAVAVIADADEVPPYLNGRQIWSLATGSREELERRDRNGDLAAHLERLRLAAVEIEGNAHFPTSDHPIPDQDEGRLFLLAIGPAADWFGRYSRLGRQLEGNGRALWQDEVCALREVAIPPGAPAPMGALIEIEEVSQVPDPEGVFGCHIDAPAPGAVLDAHTAGIAGWAIGAEGSPVVAIELASGGEAFRRVPLGTSRPDLELAFPERDGIGQAGFETSVSLVGPGTGVEIEVRAVLKDQRRVPVAALRGRRRWRETLAGPAPLVSAIIPCHGQAPYLEEAIESVLAQTYAQVEVIVVDDGSPDNASRVAARFPGVRCVRQPNRGLAAARNTGIRESEGELLVFLDSDDRLLPRALEIGVAELRARPEAAFAFGRYHRVDPQGARLQDDEQPRPEADPYAIFLRYNYAGVPGGGIYRRSALEAVGNFDESLPQAEDYDLALRLAREHAVRPHDEFVVEYRVHGGGMSRDLGAMLKMTQRVLRGERRHARRRSLRADYREGRRFWRRYYGAPLVAEVRTGFANREWGRAWRGTRALARLYPRGLVALLRRPRA